MASVLPEKSVGTRTTAFAEAVNGLAVGVASLDQARTALAAALQTDPTALPACQAILDDALQEGRLATGEHAALAADLGPDAEDDTPTEWSEDVVNEASPASDTAWPDNPVGDPDEAPARAALLYPGAVLRNRFVLQARLKSTGMSEVFKALDRRRQEAGAADPWVAIKLVTPGVPHYAEALGSLQQEAALAQRLQHPHIVRVFDFDRDGDYAFLTMEWLDGESLGELLTRLRHRPLALAEVQPILTQVAGALAFTHGRGIVHADVKPGNIIVTADGTARLLDFGLARAATNEADPDTEARTPAYASCEVLEGAAPTPQDDVYSLACVAYRMLAGRRAFGHHDALAAERSGRRPAPIRTLAPSQWAALEQALAFRRAARTPNVATFLHEFTAARTDEPAPVLPLPRPATPSAAQSTATAAPRGRFTLAAGVATLAAIVLVAMWPDEPAPPPIVAPAPDDPPVTAASTPAPAAGAGTPAPVEPVPVPAPAPAPAQAAVTPPAPVSTPLATPAAAPVPVAGPAPDTRRGVADSAPRTTAESAPPSPSKPLAEVAATTVPTTVTTPTSPPATFAAPALPAAPVEPAASEPVTATAAPASTAPGPAAVALSELHFRRYVEPRVNTRRDAPDGWVELGFLVGTDGVPRDIAVIDSSPPGHYDRAALDAIRRWRFEPVRVDGMAVEQRSSVRLRFQSK